MLTRHKPLKRSKPPRSKRDTPRRSGRARDPKYLAWVRGLPFCYMAVWLEQERTVCLAVGDPEQRAMHFADFLETKRLARGCLGLVEADHQGERPLGRKADDNTAVPMCTCHHWLRTNYEGLHRGWRGERMRRWCDEAIAWTQEQHRRHMDPAAGIPF